MTPSQQPFPEEGRLAETLNVSVDALRSLVGDAKFQEADVYCYIVATVRSDGRTFSQTGNGPNFQGDLLTLCTCKHFMRTFLDVRDWKGKWVAGFTSSQAGRGRNALVYIMAVGNAFESHLELWLSDALTPAAKEAKAADLDAFGDLYRPMASLTDPFEPSRYRAPVEHHGHAANNIWHQDIDYVGCGGRRAALLVGDSGLSFLWNKPMILYPRARPNLHRGQKKWTLGRLVGELEDAETS